MTRRRLGSGALEFALTLPFLLAVLLGIVELSTLIHREHVITRAARDACRIGTGVLEGVNPTGEQIEATAEAHARAALAEVGVDCGITACDIQADWHERAGWMVLDVAVGVAYTPVTRLFPFVPPVTRGSFRMLTQQQRPATP